MNQSGYHKSVFFVFVLLITGSIAATAVLYPYLVDDAFISFRITQNLVESGLPYFRKDVSVYTSTSLVYPYINAIWAILIGKNWTQWIPLINGFFLSMAIGVTLWKALFRKENLNLLPAFGAFLTVLPWFLDYKTLAYGNSGLETTLYLFLISVFCLPTPKPAFSQTSGLSWFLIFIRPDGFLAGFSHLSELVATRNWKAVQKTILFSLVALGLWFATGKMLFGAWVPQSMMAKSNHLIHRWTEIQKGLGYLLFAGNQTCLVLSLAGFVYFPGIRKKFIAPFSWMVVYILFFSGFGAWWPWYLPPLFVPFWYLSLVSAYEIIDFGIAKALQYRILPLSAILILSGCLVRCYYLGSKSIESIKTSSEAYQIRATASREVGKYLDAHVKSGQTVLLEPAGLLGWYSNRNLMDYPGLTRPEISRFLGSLPWKIPHRLTDAKTNDTLIRTFLPDYLVIWPEEASAFGKSPFFTSHYQLKTQMAYFPADPKMNQVFIFERMENEAR